MVSNFFGLTPADKVPVILEGNFNLIYYMGFSLTECRNLPVIEKRWYLERMLQEINKSHNTEDGSTQSRGVQHNTSDMRNLQNRTHSNPPAKLRRFT